MRQIRFAGSFFHHYSNKSTVGTYLKTIQSRPWILWWITCEPIYISTQLKRMIRGKRTSWLSIGCDWQSFKTLAKRNRGKWFRNRAKDASSVNFLRKGGRTVSKTSYAREKRKTSWRNRSNKRPIVVKRQESKNKDFRTKRNSKKEVNKEKGVNNKNDRAVARGKNLQNSHRNIPKNQKEKVKNIAHLIVSTQKVIIKQIKKAKTRI